MSIIQYSYETITNIYQSTRTSHARRHYSSRAGFLHLIFIVYVTRQCAVRSEQSRDNTLLVYLQLFGATQDRGIDAPCESFVFLHVTMSGFTPLRTDTGNRPFYHQTGAVRCARRSGWQNKHRHISILSRHTSLGDRATLKRHAV
jgi:hypothetical protein